MPSIGVGIRSTGQEDDLELRSPDELRGYVMCLRESLWAARLESDKFKILWNCAMRELEKRKHDKTQSITGLIESLKSHVKDLEARFVSLEEDNRQKDCDNHCLRRKLLDRKQDSQSAEKRLENVMNSSVENSPQGRTRVGQSDSSTLRSVEGKESQDYPAPHKQLEKSKSSTGLKSKAAESPPTPIPIDTGIAADNEGVSEEHEVSAISHAGKRGTRALKDSGSQPQKESGSLRVCKCGSRISDNESTCRICVMESRLELVGNREQKHSATAAKKDSDKDVKSEQLTERKESETRISDAMPKDKSITGAGCRDEKVVYAMKIKATNMWHCGHCNHPNSGDNVFCEECYQEPVFYDENVLGGLKEASASPGISVRRDSFGKWICPKCNKWNGGVECFDCTFAPALKVTREYTGSGFRTPQGDWIADLTGMSWYCPNCKGENYKDLEVCGTCKIAPRFIDNKHGVSGRIAVQETPTVRRDSTCKWTCPECSKWNGGMKCYRCKFQLSGEIPLGGVLIPRGDWTVEINGLFWRCPNCDVENSQSLFVCNTCKIAPRSITEKKIGTTSSTSVREKLSVRRNSTGQWQCPKCFEWKSDRECYKCKVVPSFESTPEGAVAGDEKCRVERRIVGGWNCPQCNGVNLQNDDVCYKCKIQPTFIKEKPKVCRKCNMINKPNTTYCRSCYKTLD